MASEVNVVAPPGRPWEDLALDPKATKDELQSAWEARQQMIAIALENLSEEDFVEIED